MIDHRIFPKRNFQIKKDTKKTAFDIKGFSFNYSNDCNMLTGFNLLNDLQDKLMSFTFFLPVSILNLNLLILVETAL